MINRAFQFITNEVRGLQHAAYVLAGAALLSSVLALARDRLLAHTFGASASLDVYYAAFRIPDLIFVATGALVSVYILIPELARRTDKEQHLYLDTIIAGFSLFAVVVSLVAALITPYLLAVLFPQLVAAGHLEMLTLLTRIILLQPILLGLSNILAAVTQSRHRYTLYSMSPLLYNIGIIFGIMVLYPQLGMVGLAYGIVIGAALHLLVQMPSVIEDGFLNAWPRIHSMRALLDTAMVSLPRALSLSMTQIAFLGLAAIAGGLVPGSLAVFMLAYNLQAVPLSIVGASYSVAAFPTLAAALSRGERDVFVQHIATAARYVLFWSLPCSALIITLRAHMVRFVLGSGAFDWTDTRLTAAVFAILSISLVAQGLTLLLIRGYYAAGRTFVPFLVSAATAFSTFLGALLAIQVFQHHVVLNAVASALRVADVPGVSVLSLGISYAAASIGGALFLTWHFERRFKGFIALIARTWWESVAAALGALASSYVVLSYMGPLDVGSTTISIFVRGCAGGVSGIVAAILCYMLLGSEEMKGVIGMFRTRLALGRAHSDLVAVPSEETSVQ